MAELAVIVLGVMIALAADSWREGALDSRIASQYQERLREDVAMEAVSLRELRGRFADARVAAGTLTSWAWGDSVLSPQDIASELVVAGAMGVDRQELGSDVTYQELIASGQLVLLPEDVRRGVVAYYREAERLAQGLESLPLVNERVAQATGYNPIEFLVHGQSLDADDTSRLVQVARDTPEIQRELSLLHAELVFYDRLFATVIEQAERLLLTLE